MAINANATNFFSPAKWVVSTVAGEGTHTTISSALTSASAGDTIFIMPGTYSTNNTLKAGVNLTAWDSDSSQNGTGIVLLTGNSTYSGTGTVTISGIQFQTNSSQFFTTSGSVASIVNFNNCYFNCTNSAGIILNSTGVGSALNFNNCFGDLGSAGTIPLFGDNTNTPTNIKLKNCLFTNSGGSNGLFVRIGTGTIEIYNCSLLTQIGDDSSSGIINIYNTSIDTSAVNQPCLSLTGPGGTINCFECNLTSGTASSIVVNSGMIATIFSSNANSSNANVFTGTGTINYGGVIFNGTSSVINVTTQIPVAFTVPQGGTGLTTTVANQILYSSSAGVIAGLATGNSGVLDTTASGVPQIDTTNFHVLTTGVQVKGNNASTTPPAGFIGEQIRSAVAQGSAITLTNTSPANITSISLTAGIWDISATGIVGCSGANTNQYLSVGTSSATLGTLGDNATQLNLSNTGGNFPLAIPSWRLLLASTTPVYLVAQANFTTGG